MNKTACKNCGKQLVHRENFCPSCGQKAGVHGLTFHSLLHEIIHYFTHAEKNIFSLIRQLTFKPGVVAEEYLAGKRKRYFSPVNFFLIAAGLLVIAVSALHTFDGAFIRAGSGRVETTNPLLHLLSSKINWIFFLLIPLFALLYRLAYWKRKFNYVEHLAASLYWQGYILLLFAVVLAPVAYSMESPDNIYFIFYAFTALHCIYYAVAYYQLFHRKNFLYLLLYLLLSLIVTALIFCICVIMIRSFYIFTR